MKHYYFISVCIAIIAMCSTSCSDSHKRTYLTEEELHEMTDEDYSQDTIKSESDELIQKGLSTTNRTNYANNSKELFGIEVTDKGGWKLRDVKSSDNGSLHIVYDATNTNDIIEDITNEYFNRCISITTDGNYSVSKDGNGNVTREKIYTDYKSFRNDRCRRMWAYCYNGKYILFSINNGKNNIEFSFDILPM